MKGFIYVFSNPTLTGLKIGRTGSDPARRAKELQSTGVPTAFNIEYYAFVQNFERMEEQIHRSLSKNRIDPNREFFTCSVPVAIETIRSVCGKNLESEKIFYQSPEEIELYRKEKEQRRAKDSERRKREQEIRAQQRKKEKDEREDEKTREREEADRNLAILQRVKKREERNHQINLKRSQKRSMYVKTFQTAAFKILWENNLGSIRKLGFLRYCYSHSLWGLGFAWALFGIYSANIGGYICAGIFLLFVLTRIFEKVEDIKRQLADKKFPDVY